MRSEEEIREFLEHLLEAPKVEDLEEVYALYLLQKFFWFVFEGRYVIGTLLWVLGYTDLPLNSNALREGLKKYFEDKYGPEFVNEVFGRH